MEYIFENTFKIKKYNINSVKIYSYIARTNGLY